MTSPTNLAEKIMISIAHNDEKSFSDKLTIEINNSNIEKRIDESDKSTASDPVSDTLERNLDKRSDPQQENAKGRVYKYVNRNLHLEPNDQAR